MSSRDAARDPRSSRRPSGWPSSGRAVAWTLADVWEAAADRFPDALAVAVPGRAVTWREFDARADGLARHLLDTGLGYQAKVAQYLYNCPQYLESFFACTKAALVPVNTNYRYTGEELAYLWDNADAEAIVFHGAFAEQCEELRPRLPGVRAWLWVDDGSGPCPDWAVSYEDVATAGVGRVVPTHHRSGDDLVLLYTGGTTGQPKGVMWRQDTLFRMLEELNGRDVASFGSAAERAEALTAPGPRVLPAPPLMHGTALFFALPVLGQGGCVVTTNGRRFDPEALLDVLVDEGVKGLCIVGDAFAKPLVDALDREPDRWDLGGVRVVFSSGVVLSPLSKERLLAHLPRATIVDSLGSSETGSVARSLSSASGTTASFRLGGRTRVIDEDDRDVVPGSGVVGRVVLAGHQPTGYYGDPVKTAETFVQLDGVSHVITGDWAEVEADGTLRFLGRGSVSINTGGEKVYPEEVEEAIKLVGGVHDAVVVGVPDERLGEVVAAVVEPQADASVDVDHLTATLRTTLAGFKVPRVVVLQPIGRAVNGKADYRALRDVAIQAAAS